jgi:hypothetical protein
MAVSEHAMENLKKYAKITGVKQAKRLFPLMAQALKMDGSTAAVITLDKAYENPFRPNWKPNDVLAAIIRNGEVVTIMMTRTEQVNKAHFRTDNIIG